MIHPTIQGAIQFEFLTFGTTLVLGGPLQKNVIYQKLGNVRFRGPEGLAEREGFEPSRRFPAYTLSRRAPSTTRPPLRISVRRASTRPCRPLSRRPPCRKFVRRVAAHSRSGSGGTIAKTLVLATAICRNASTLSRRPCAGAARPPLHEGFQVLMHRQGRDGRPVPVRWDWDGSGPGAGRTQHDFALAAIPV